MTLSSGKNVQINISVGAVVKTVVVLSALAVLYYLFDLVLVIISSVVLASAIEPMVEWLGKKGVNRTVSVLAIYIASFVSILAMLYFLLPPLLHDFRGLSTTIPDRLETISDYTKESAFSLSNISLDLAGNLTLNDLALVLQSSFGGLTGGAIQTASILFGGVFSFILIIVISFYLAVQEDGVENVLKVITPVKHEKYIIDLWKRSRKKIGLWMQGQIFLGIFMAIFVFLGLSLLRIKYALLLALLAGVFEIIPYFGPILSAAPAVLLGFSDNVVSGFLVLGFYVIMQQFENHLLYPQVVKKMVGVPALLVIISMIIGGKLAGFLGILISVPVAAVLMEFLADWEKKKHLFAEKAGS